MIVAIALRGCYDLGCLVTPTVLFFPGTYFYLQLPPHYPKMNKKTIWGVKKIQDFCPRDIASCHLATARRV